MIFLIMLGITSSLLRSCGGMVFGFYINQVFLFQNVISNKVRGRHFERSQKSGEKSNNFYRTTKILIY